MRFFKIIFFILFLSFYSKGVAQKRIKQDKHLDSLAKKIQFQYKELIFIKGSLEAIKEIVSYIKDNKKYYVIESHTCMRKSRESNQELTDRRAVMLNNIFVNIGLDSSKFVSIGYGQDEPCCNIGKTGKQRYKNRRIEIKEVSEEEIKQLKKSKK